MISLFQEFLFNKKCDINMCQNQANFSLSVGKKGSILFCKHCLDKLKKFKTNNGGSNERTKTS